MPVFTWQFASSREINGQLCLFTKAVTRLLSRLVWLVFYVAVQEKEFLILDDFIIKKEIVADWGKHTSLLIAKLFLSSLLSVCWLKFLCSSAGILFLCYVTFYSCNWKNSDVIQISSFNPSCSDWFLFLTRQVWN